MQALAQRQALRAGAGRQATRRDVSMAATAKVGGKNVTFAKYQGLGNDFIVVRIGDQDCEASAGPMPCKLGRRRD